MDQHPDPLAPQTEGQTMTGIWTDAQIRAEAAEALAAVTRDYERAGLPTTHEQAAAMTLALVFERAAATAAMFVDHLPQAGIVVEDFRRLYDAVLEIVEERDL